MSNFPVDEAQIIALFMESIAYGAFLVSQGMCYHVLLYDQRGPRRTVNWAMFIITTVMAVFATFDVALGLRHNLEAFIFYAGPGGPDGEFDDISNWVNVMKTVNTQMMSLIGDGMLVYRCYVVFLHRWKIIIVPLLMWLANAVLSAIIIFITATLHQDAIISCQASLKPFLYSFFAINIILNILTTGMIILQIWRVNKKSSPYVTRSDPQYSCTRLEQVMRIIIELGLLYTALMIATFICELASSNAIYGVSDVLVVAVGISFNLIIIRLNWTTTMSMASREVTLTYPLRFMRSSRTTSPRGAVEVMATPNTDGSHDISGSESQEPVKDEWNAV
ncbi:hypothetical protein NM688_g3430 [Phlebia brevispora]|uniref:Uncharacterized protein n=1 Tax=Phlebia brevispora TaxID=194682 RepID=A0ACC1T5V4_9APHY|nr:hypothetical protein NM688_g3430 [Phlebia brevispora]